MKAAVYENFQYPLSVQKVKDPIPSEDGVVIQVCATGLCLSDWHGWMGHDPDIILPHVPGHELAGTVAEVGKKVKKWKRGERVTVPFVAGCGTCEQCTSGNQQVCDHQFQPGFTAWGSFAEYVAIAYADENLVALPDHMGFVAAASLGCRFITAYRAVREQGRVKPGDLVAVHGCGGVGLSAIQIAKALGASVIGIDITEDKCKLAMEMGADHVINANHTEVVPAIMEYSRGGVQVSVDALGSSSTCLNSIYSLRKRGKHIQVGLMTGTHANPSIPMSTIIARELEILGSHGMQAHCYTDMFQFIENAGLDLNRMVRETIPLEEVPVRLPELDSQRSPGITVVNRF